MEYSINAEDLDPTLDEVLEIQKVAGKPLSKMDELEATKAVVYIAIKKQNADFTWEDAGKIKMSFLQTLVGMAVPLEGSES